MTTATSVTYEDLARLRDLMIALHEAGQIEEAATIERAHAVIQRLFIEEHMPWIDDDDDPEFVRQMEAAERDQQEGRLIPHEEVMARLEALDDSVNARLGPGWWRTAMTTTTTPSVTYDDLARLSNLMVGLHESGRIEDANTIARAYSVVQDLFMAEHYSWLDEYDDPEFRRQMEESERDFAEGRWSSHEDVMRRFQALGDG